MYIDVYRGIEKKSKIFDKLSRPKFISCFAVISQVANYKSP